MNNHIFVEIKAIAQLDLSGNEIGDIGAQHLAYALQNNKVINLWLSLI